MQIGQFFSNVQNKTMDAAVNIELGIKPDADRNRVSQLIISIADKVFSLLSSSYADNRQVTFDSQRLAHFGEDHKSKQAEVMAQIKELGENRSADEVLTDIARAGTEAAAAR